MRDPRVDPRAGDVFVKGSGRAEITRATGMSLVFTFEGRFSDCIPMKAWNEEWVPSFREWAKDATVIHRAEDGNG